MRQEEGGRRSMKLRRCTSLGLELMHESIELHAQLFEVNTG